jgi:2-polyprenyl-3-methyl-5-hydroxy-6-metoxy-1,4-benzoquinol methylase
MELAVAVDVAGFVASHLGPPPARVLEVGCGNGDLARALAARGYEMTAIDPEAPDGDIFRRASLEDFNEAGPFDAVVAVRSLHHVHDLEGGVRKIHSRGGQINAMGYRSVGTRKAGMSR